MSILGLQLYHIIHINWLKVLCANLEWVTVRGREKNSAANGSKRLPSPFFKHSCQVETGTDYLAEINFYIAIHHIIVLVINNYLLGIYAQ
jgi:hypothetical protein